MLVCCLCNYIATLVHSPNVLMMNVVLRIPRVQILFSACAAPRARAAPRRTCLSCSRLAVLIQSLDSVLHGVNETERTRPGLARGFCRASTSWGYNWPIQ